ncbi:hypothetical protein QBC32DRAFT_351317 [Pseudoneurospora amorphoporcata]|uniref:Uncharacterized protein n=1 Tax=Pseudoneurospora amorphoporcata TaxID=241081 RepID=A0AAN6NMF1_9PEZI|nr:hypothetical protein QBC32DRAFT_351317 [Pseudoneurospora amorphoporcata]
MPKNAAITSFFKPAPRDSQDSQGSSQAPQSSIPRSPIRAVMSPFKMPGTPGTGFKSSLPIRSPVPPPCSPLTLLSSPLKPRSIVKPVRDRNAVIGASDEDDNDSSDFISSDDDLPDLFAEPKTEVPVSIRANKSPTRGPSSKRVASAKLVVSPINFNKKHKFDMKAILKHTEAEKKIAESEKRVEKLMAEDEEEKTAEPLAVKKEGTTTLHDDICNMMSEAEDSQEETKKEKLLRAVKRIEATSQRTRWYFFDDDHGHKAVDDLSISFRNKFPQQAATGAWKILAPQKGRMDLIERGVAYHLQCKLQNIPDEIFIWIVDELPFVKTRRLRESNLRLLGICPEQAGRLLTPDRITQLFRTIGTPKRCLETPSSSSSEDNSEQKKPDPGRPYNIDRDWTPLRTVLRILSETSGGLSINSLTRSTTLLLRLGMDALIRRNPDLHSTFRQTLIHLVEAVPSSSFDAFCLSCCTSLYSLTTNSCLLSDALRALPYQTPKLVNLRRRLALAFLFASASTSLFPSPFGPGSLVPSPIQEFSSSDPSQTFTLPLLLAYLDISPHFQPTRSSSSADYFVLSAQTDLLRIAIGDGDPPSSSSSSSTPPVSSRSSSLPPLTRPSVPFSASRSTSKSTSPETKLHNRQIDLLTKRIRTLWSNIHDQSGSSAEISRLEAKLKLKDLERKLEWAVRTKPVSRANIFGVRSGTGGAGSGILGGGGGEDQEFDSEEEREREMKREREGTEQKMFMRRFLGKGMVAAAAKTDV